MKKVILLLCDRYQRLLYASKSQNEGVKTHAVHPFSKNYVEEEENDTKRIERSEPEYRGNTLASLLPYFSKCIQNRVHSHLTYIQPHVSWNSKGVISKGTLIRRSNTVDLIKVYMKDYNDFRPVGKDAFGEILLELICSNEFASSKCEAADRQRYFTSSPGNPHQKKST